MEGNPIKYSDLIEPDDSIEEATKQIYWLEEAFQNLYATVKKEAKNLLGGMEDVKESTEASRLSAEDYATATAKLSKAKQDLRIAEDTLGRQIDEHNELVKEQVAVNKENIKVSKTVETSYNRLTAEYAKNKRALDSMTKKEREKSKEGKKLTKETKKLSDQIKEMDNSVKGATKSTKKAGSSMGALSTASGKASSGIGGTVKQLWALATHPVVLVIMAIVGAFKLFYEALTSTLEGQQLFNEAMAYGQAAVTAVMEVLSMLAIIIMKQVIPWIKILSQSFKLAMDSIKRDILAIQEDWARLWGNTEKADGFLEKIKEIDGGIVGLKESLKTLFDEQKKTAKEWESDWDGVVKKFSVLGQTIVKNAALLIENSKLNMALQEEEMRLMKRNADLQVKVDDLHAKSEQFRRADAVKGLGFLKESYKLREQIAVNEIRLARIAHQISVNNMKTFPEKTEYRKAEAQAYADMIQAEAKLGVVKREGFRQANRFHTQAIAQARARIASTRRTNAAEAGESRRADEKTLSEFTYNLKEREAAATRLAETQKRLAKEVHDDIQMNLADEVKDFQGEDDGTKSRLDYQILANEQSKILADERVRIDTEMYQKISDLRWEDLQERAELSRRILENRTAFHDLELEMELISIDISRRSDATKHRKSLQMEQKFMKARLALLLEHLDVANEVEMKELEARIKQMDYMIRKARKDEDLFDLLGLGVDDDMKAGLSSAFSYALGQMQEFLDAKIRMADEAVKAADREVAATQKMLDYELTARANGFASNVEFAQKERGLAERQQMHAIAQKKKLQKAQEKIQTAEQATSLLTASALIWSQLGNPLLALPAIAIMWGSFAAAKVQAAKASKGTESYGSGHVEMLQGGSHASGNDIDLGVKADGTRRRAEGGEYFAVINKRSSKRFGKQIPGLINSLNDGSFPDKYANAFTSGQGMNLAVNHNQINLGQIEGDLRDIKERNSRRRHFDAKGNVVEEYKNLTRIIRL